MDLIIGGAYQGKLDYAKKQYELTEEQVFTCNADDGIVFGTRCIDCLEEFALWCVRCQTDAAEYFQTHRTEWENSILICRDIFCGVVPVEAEQREWREMTGRLCAYLARNAKQVIRIYCGLEQRLK